MGLIAENFFGVEQSPLKIIPALPRGDQAGTFFGGVREKIVELRCAREDSFNGPIRNRI